MRIIQCNDTCFNWRVAISTSKSSIYETSAITCLNVDLLLKLENGILSIFSIIKVTLSIPFETLP